MRFLKKKGLLFKIGKLLSEVWDIRENIYRDYPQLKK